MAQVVAVVGASRDRRKFGNKAVRAFLHRGYDVIPINPEGGTIEGLVTYASVLDVSRPIEMATVYVQPAVGVRLMAEIADKGIEEVWLNIRAPTSTRSSHAPGRSGWTLSSTAASSALAKAQPPIRDPFMPPIRGLTGRLTRAYTRPR
jgi:predicted CoA-binding protein